MNGRLIAIVMVLCGLVGCGRSSTPNDARVLGRALQATPASPRQAPAPSGDPVQERNGTVPRTPAGVLRARASGFVAPTPQAALRRFALTYINWRASALGSHERRLAALAVGAARAAARQTIASRSAWVQLTAAHVQNSGTVLAIAAGHGPDRGRWIIVTQERTIGTGAYAGLPVSPHVTIARTVSVARNWRVSEWEPQS
jgi:hypothetical protein